MLGGVRSVLSPLPLPLWPPAQSLSLCRARSFFLALSLSLSYSLPPVSLSLSRSFHSLPCDSFGSLSLSFFLSLCTGSFFFHRPTTLLPPVPTTPVAARSPSFFSLLMPRDRQMMIKKAPVRVRTTPRRPVPTPAPRSPPSPPPLSPPSPPPCLPPSPPPAILLPLFLSRFSPPRVTLPLPPAGRGLSLSLFFFRRLISARSLFPRLSPFSTPSAFFPSPRAFPPCGYTFVACIMVRGERLRTARPLFVTDSFAEERWARLARPLSDELARSAMVNARYRRFQREISINVRDASNEPIRTSVSVKIARSRASQCC